MTTNAKSKNEKSKIRKLIERSEPENDENEHELSYYINDRVKLMKEVLKIIKPKKIKSMAPDCIKDLDIEEINSMLLEELLGISNKRLKYIFNGQNLEEDSSSTDEEEKPVVDIISLDDVSEDDFEIIDSDKPRKKQKIKKEKVSKHQRPLQPENLMNVLELLELQARARAIRSQLALEANKKAEQTEAKTGDSDSDDAVIMEIPKSEEIVIESTESESEAKTSHVKTQKKKIKLIRDRVEKVVESHGVEKVVESHGVEKVVESHGVKTVAEVSNKEVEDSNVQEEQTEDQHNEDEIILIVDQEEMAGIIGE